MGTGGTAHGNHGYQAKAQVHLLEMRLLSGSSLWWQPALSGVEHFTPFPLPGKALPETKHRRKFKKGFPIMINLPNNSDGPYRVRSTGL